MPKFRIDFSRSVYSTAEQEIEAPGFIQANRIADDRLRQGQIPWEPDGQDENFDVEEVDQDDTADEQDDQDDGHDLFTRVNGTTFISRRSALQLLYGDEWTERTRMRNYEIEDALRANGHGDQVCISEWCPYDGRFCTLRDHVAPPHPPCTYESPPYQDDSIGVPWNVFGGGQVSRHVRSDVVESEG